MAVTEQAVEVEKDVEYQWVTIDGERMKMYFVKDGPSTHEDYLRFLEFQARVSN